MKVILAIDGGGSRTRCLAIDQQGQVVGQAETGPSNHLLIGAEIVKRSLAEAIQQTLEAAQLERDSVVCVSAGMAGVDFDGADASAIEELSRELGFAGAVVNGDMVIAHAGAFGLKKGVIALAGTGSAILGIGANGERVKVGGWGPVYGDEGSAYRIGQLSLRAAAREYDGRGPATALYQSLLKALGLHDFKETVARVYVEGMEPREIAALSGVAYEAAMAGDAVARSIFARAGVELAESVETAIRQLGLSDEEVAVSYQGSVIESCQLLREHFIESLKQSVPKASVSPPEFEPIIGAYLLGCKRLGWEVDAGVFAELKKRSFSTNKTVSEGS